MKNVIFRCLLTMAALLLAMTPSAQAQLPAPASSRPAVTFDPAMSRYVLVATDKGDMVFELDYAHAPVSVANFLAYVDQHFYDGTLFHRVGRRDDKNPINIIQGGGFNPDMTEKKANSPIANESNNGLTHTRGAVAMARRRAPESATCQFFIDTTDNPMLDRQAPGHGHAVFAHVVAGMAVADAIQGLELHANTSGEVSLPFTPPVIKSITRITAEQAKPLIAAEPPIATRPAAAAQTAPATRPAPPIAATAPSASPPTAAAPVAGMVYVLMKTTKGDIVLELNHDKAPVSVDNFLSYVDKKFYDGTVFHRIISNFMIQGGGFTEDNVQKPTSPGIANEWRNGLKNVKGSIAMARIGGRPDSGTSQFFINTGDNAPLDQPQRDGAAYAVFGKVVAGMKTVDAIRSVPVEVGPGGERSKPTETVTILSAERITAEQAKTLIEAAAH